MVAKESRVHGYVQGAPLVLIEHFERGRARVGREVLLQLLTRPEMRGAWRQLARRIDKPEGWERLWGEVKVAMVRSSRTPERRARSAGEYEKLAVQLRRIADRINGGELDVLAYEVFPADDWPLLGVRDWEELGSLERHEAAIKLLPHWPSAHEVLYALAHKAATVAHNRKYEPRLIERARKDVRKSYLARAIAQYFKATFKSPLYGTVAIMVSTILRSPVSKEFVERSVARMSTRLDFRVKP